MKLRFLIVSALALAFMVPVALANDSTDGDGTKEDVHAEVKDTKDHDEATEGDKKYDEKKKYEESKKYDNAKAKKYKKHRKHGMKKLCRPRVGVYVRGELVSVNAEAGMFTVAVNKANRHGKRFLDAKATFKLAKKGKVRKHGKATLADLKPGMLVKVMGRACRSEIKDENETPELYAKHVKAKYPIVDGEKDKKTGEKAEDNEEKAEEKTDGSNEEPKDETADAAV